jgi:hypothetical protein
VKRIAFKTDTELEVVTEFDEAHDCIMGTRMEVFRAGESVEVDIIDGEFNHCDLQFGDGSVAHGIFRECFTVIE